MHFQSNIERSARSP